MAYITTEDCIKNIANRFDLVLLAARRARDLLKGNDPRVPSDENKDSVIALREIAEGKVSPETLQDEIFLSIERKMKGEGEKVIAKNDFPNNKAVDNENNFQEQNASEEDIYE